MRILSKEDKGEIIARRSQKGSGRAAAVPLRWWMWRDRRQRQFQGDHTLMRLQFWFETAAFSTETPLFNFKKIYFPINSFKICFPFSKTSSFSVASSCFTSTSGIIPSPSIPRFNGVNHFAMVIFTADPSGKLSKS